jgi:predicted metalloendopeptidase
VRDLIKDILDAMQSALAGVHWLDDEARSMAASKLADMVALVGIRDEVLNLTRMDIDYEPVGN